MAPLNKFRWILVASGAAAIGCAASGADRPAAEAKPAPPPPVAVAPAPTSAVPAARPAGPGGVIAYFLGKPFQVRSVLLFPEQMKEGARQTELQIFDVKADCETGRRILEDRVEVGEASLRTLVAVTLMAFDQKVLTTGVFQWGFQFRAIKEGEFTISDGADAQHARVTVNVVSEDQSSRVSGELTALRCPLRAP